MQLPKVAITTLRTTADLLLTAGVLALLFVSYQLLAKPAQIADEQRQLATNLQQTWRQDDDSPPRGETHADQGIDVPPVPRREGTPFARLSIPKLQQQWTVVQGVSATALRDSPGHYPHTAMPGQRGNFAVAGHRSRGLFLDLDEVGRGDVVNVETERAWFTYRVYQRKIVGPDAAEVLAPIPERPGARPKTPVLTLTTCDPVWSSAHRLIVHAELAQAHKK